MTRTTEALSYETLLAAYHRALEENTKLQEQLSRQLPQPITGQDVGVTGDYGTAIEDDAYADGFNECLHRVRQIRPANGVPHPFIELYAQSSRVAEVTQTQNLRAAVENCAKWLSQ